MKVETKGRKQEVDSEQGIAAESSVVKYCGLTWRVQ